MNRFLIYSLVVFGTILEAASAILCGGLCLNSFKSSDFVMLLRVLPNERNQAVQLRNLASVILVENIPVFQQIIKGSTLDRFARSIFEGDQARQSFKAWEQQLVSSRSDMPLATIQHPSDALQRPTLLALGDQLAGGIINSLSKHGYGYIWLSEEQGALDRDFQVSLKRGGQHKTAPLDAHWMPCVCRLDTLKYRASNDHPEYLYCVPYPSTFLNPEWAFRSSTTRAGLATSRSLPLPVNSGLPRRIL